MGDLIGQLISAGQMAFLAGIFWRIGALNAAVRYLEQRLLKLEGETP